MSSKRRLRRRSCESKKRYATQAEAGAAMARTNRRSEFPRKMSPYHCRFCGGWHFGRRSIRRSHP